MLWARRREPSLASRFRELVAGDRADEDRRWTPSVSGAYDHYCAGMELLVAGNPAQAAVRLEKAKTLEPAKGSIREALGRAYFALGRWPDAESEFRGVLELTPVNDYAHYCLSRSLRKQGRATEADAHLKLARAMNPESAAYRYLPGL